MPLTPGAVGRLTSVVAIRQPLVPGHGQAQLRPACARAGLIEKNGGLSKGTGHQQFHQLAVMHLRPSPRTGLARVLIANGPHQGVLQPQVENQLGDGFR